MAGNSQPVQVKQILISKLNELSTKVNETKNLNDAYKRITIEGLNEIREAAIRFIQRCKNLEEQHTELSTSHDEALELSERNAEHMEGTNRSLEETSQKLNDAQSEIDNLKDKIASGDASKAELAAGLKKIDDDLKKSIEENTNAKSELDQSREVQENLYKIIGVAIQKIHTIIQLLDTFITDYDVSKLGPEITKIIQLLSDGDIPTNSGQGMSAMMENPLNVRSRTLRPQGALMGTNRSQLPFTEFEGVNNGGAKKTKKR